MSFFNKFLLVFCALFALTGCQDHRVDVYIHEDTGCQSDSDCDAVYGGDTFTWCDMEAGNGTCHYETYYEYEIPNCYSDLDCDDGDSTSSDTCNANGCTHVIREVEVIEVPAPSEGANITATFATEGRLTIVDGNTWGHLGDLTITANNTIGRRQILGIVFSGANAGAWSGVALAQNGAVVNTAVPVSTGSFRSSIVFNFDSLFLAAGETMTYQVWGKTDETYFTSTSRSDPTVSLSLDGLRMNGNAEDIIVSEESGTFWTMLRKTKPTVTRQALATTTLGNTTQDLYRMQISADAHGSVEVHSLAFELDGNSTNLALSHFEVRVGSQPLPPSDYTVRGEVGLTDYRTSGLALGDGAILIIHFINPQIVTGSGVVLTLSATISGTQSGDQVTIRPYTSAPWGHVASGWMNAAGRLVFSSEEVYTSSIVWRDGAHNFSDTLGHWAYGDYDILDLTQVQVLTR